MDIKVGEGHEMPRQEETLGTKVTAHQSGPERRFEPVEVSSRSAAAPGCQDTLNYQMDPDNCGHT